MVTNPFSFRPYAGGAVCWVERVGLPAILDSIRVELFFTLAVLGWILVWTVGLLVGYCIG